MAVSNQTKIALASSFDVGVAKEIADNLDSNFGSSSIVGGSLDVSSGGITCGTITSSANVTAASGLVTGGTVVGTSAGTFSTCIITANGIIVPVLASDPSSPTEGQLYYNTTSHKLKIRVAAAWETITSA